ncbi:hypothetical protein OFN97_00625 [Campylobacter sp. VBCF_05 NA6]|nr:MULTISPECIES: hypothetical protein [unclassified Campylobacter]MDA3057623.1 hypothetical protein [Campylobacter sp. VBCF_04 NA7]MDA3058524.1 hypothetical protein [Campylobacter sp. VBCF_05 NA6]
MAYLSILASIKNFAKAIEEILTLFGNEMIKICEILSYEPNFGK